MTWSPPPRPDWVRHALDGSGGPVFERAGQPLVAEQLLAEGVLRSGTSEVRCDDLLEPLEVFTESVEREADLHLLGRWRVREVLLRAIESRHRMTAWTSRHPEVSDERVVRPVIVTGSPRAGTSIMHELLALSSYARAPLAWEYWWPAPPSDDPEDPRIPLANHEVRLSAALNPGFDAMHEQGALVPREDMSGMLLALRSDVLSAHYPTPSYASYLASCDMAPAYELHRLILQVLQAGRDPRRWVMKAPGHLAYLEHLLALYPDASIVVCHRDPLAMLSSVTSLTATLRWGHTARIDYPALARECADQFGRNLDHLVALHQAGVLDPDRVVHVQFDEFVADQAAVVQGISERFGLDIPPAAVAAHLEAKPRGRGGAHEHRVDDLGLDVGAERRRFADYMELFGVRQELI